MEKCVLISVLDWGLGHATRSTPIIEALAERGIRTVIAGAGQSLDYLSRRFGDIPMVEMPEQRVRYGDSGAFWALAKRAMSQTSINAAQRDFTRRMVKEHRVTHLISDNVYGAGVPELPSAIITHQLAPRTPFLQGVFHHRIAAWLDRFDEVWVPDFAGEDSLSGQLSQNGAYSGPIRHLGRLSRFHRQQDAIKNIAVTVLLSGPEPQRTIFENKAVEVCRDIPGPKVVIRGRPECTVAIPDGDIRSVPFADGMELGNYLRRSEVVLTRSGFSGLCDLVATGVRACVVPTPGQTEQVYLAERVEHLKWFARADQEKLTPDAVLGAKHFCPPEYREPDISGVLDAFLLRGSNS